MFLARFGIEFSDEIALNGYKDGSRALDEHIFETIVNDHPEGPFYRNDFTRLAHSLNMEFTEKLAKLAACFP